MCGFPFSLLKGWRVHFFRFLDLYISFRPKHDDGTKQTKNNDDPPTNRSSPTHQTSRGIAEIIVLRLLPFLLSFFFLSKFHGGGEIMVWVVTREEEIDEQMEGKRWWWTSCVCVFFLSNREGDGVLPPPHLYVGLGQELLHQIVWLFLCFSFWCDSCVDNFLFFLASIGHHTTYLNLRILYR